EGEVQREAKRTQQNRAARNRWKVHWPDLTCCSVRTGTRGSFLRLPPVSGEPIECALRAKDCEGTKRPEYARQLRRRVQRNRASILIRGNHYTDSFAICLSGAGIQQEHSSSFRDLDSRCKCQIGAN